jgi:hypothetical protein
MAYITSSNAKKIVQNLDLTNNTFSGYLYKRQINFFNRLEQNLVLAYKHFIENPEQFLTSKYVKLNKAIDTHKWVFEGGAPAFHRTSDCVKLNAEYFNLEIPKFIRARGYDAVQEFRSWVQNNSYLLRDHKLDIFFMRLRSKYGQQIGNNPKAIFADNSGVESFDNLNLEELEDRIDTLLEEQKAYYFQHRDVLCKFSRKTFLAYRDDPISENNTDYTDSELKAFLRDYNKTYKKPLIKLLYHYHRIKLNPELELSGKLLEQLNFKPCSCCHKLQSNNHNKNSYSEISI